MADTPFSELDHPVIAAINQCSNLRTRDISQVDGRAPVVELASAITQGRTMRIGGIEGVHPLEITDESVLFCLRFPDPVCFAVTDEMFAENESNKTSGSGWIKIFRSSAFLEFVQRSTWAKDEYPGPLMHFQVNTLDHRIDVVTAQPPEISKV